MISTNTYNFFMRKDMSPYIDQWIAIIDNKVVSHGKNAKTVFNEAKEAHPDSRPVITRIPGKKAMIL